ncbi:uncharacterized protein BDR25DRAFT_314007 [Lindgomyces ingoldianus]|uniref:Uncharacterized protein n=1 Tax=Lindgomyces ingoldianus TaxID=673940 RepID=A0ACB6QWR2_9PLEO|nr:uncharacterized protein BDR25DRAFT_314007 [Lindgomyces ingoldianus]KAF2471434.1 hypothetical protein BDR25DRAFT_314007 [Lindgomyces ingoldianus]
MCFPKPSKMQTPLPEAAENLERLNFTPTDVVTLSISPGSPDTGILRKPTANFPEDPHPIQDGVAPHKSALKGKHIPPGARWTKIDRRFVSPEALKQVKERFEVRQDCVVVLRVLTHDETQTLADRTREKRENREAKEDDHE